MAEEQVEAKKMKITSEGLKKYEEELEQRKTVERKKIAAKIKEAREQGDLSENAEYDEAMDEQRDNEGRIVELESILKNVEVVDVDDFNADTVNVGTTVKIHDEEFDEDVTYSIVGSSEVSILENKISNESPVGKALMNASVGDVVTVETPGGESKYKVLEITKTES